MLYSVGYIGIRFPLGVKGDVPVLPVAIWVTLFPPLAASTIHQRYSLLLLHLWGYSFVFNGVGFRVIFMIRSIIQLVGDAVATASTGPLL